MAFSAFKVFKDALNVPVQQGIDAVNKKVTTTIDRVAANVQKTVADFTNPSKVLKQSEVVDYLQSVGTVRDFSNIDETIKALTEGKDIVAVDANTGERLGKIGETLAPEAPANMFSGQSDENLTNQYKVIITAEPDVDMSEEGFSRLVLDVMPTINETRSVSYKPFTPLHHPGQIMKYESTEARAWTISAKLIARNSEEATRNLDYLNMIRTWAMPFYGEGTSQSMLKQYLGAPPPILTLSAFGPQVIGPVKCVMESYNWDWPNDCDYIQTLPVGRRKPVAVPVIISISINLKESWSPAEFSGFDLTKYRMGMLPDAFKAIPRSQTSIASAQPPLAQVANAASAPSSVGQAAQLARSEVNTMVDKATAAFGTVSNAVEDYSQLATDMNGIAGKAAKTVKSTVDGAVSAFKSGLGGSFGGGGSSGRF